MKRYYRGVEFTRLSDGQWYGACGKDNLFEIYAQRDMYGWTVAAYCNVDKRDENPFWSIRDTLKESILAGLDYAVDHPDYVPRSDIVTYDFI